MKQLFILAFLCTVCVSPIWAQNNYLVLKVSPKGQAKADHAVIVERANLHPNTNITLLQKGARLWLKTRECFYTVAQNGVLEAVLGRCISTQNGGEKRGNINSQIELQKLMSTPKLLVIDTLQLSIPVNVFRINPYQEGVEEGFMFVEVSSKQCPNGVCAIPLEVGKDNSFLLHGGVFRIGGKAIDSKAIEKITLKYAETSTQDITIANIDIIFLKTEDLREEVKTLLEDIKNLPADKQAEQVQQYLSLAYEGEMYYPHLREWLAKKFGL